MSLNFRIHNPVKKQTSVQTSLNPLRSLLAHEGMLCFRIDGSDEPTSWTLRIFVDHEKVKTLEVHAFMIRGEQDKICVEVGLLSN